MKVAVYYIQDIMDCTQISRHEAHCKVKLPALLRVGRMLIRGSANGGDRGNRKGTRALAVANGTISEWFKPKT